jgi:hypothetical protein
MNLMLNQREPKENAAIVYKNEGQSKVYAEIPAHKAPKGQPKKQQKNKRVKIVLLPQ